MELDISSCVKIFQLIENVSFRRTKTLHELEPHLANRSGHTKKEVKREGVRTHICRDFLQPASAQPQHLFAYSYLWAPRATCSFPSPVAVT